MSGTSTYNYENYKVEPINGSYRIVNNTLGRPVILEGLSLGWAETICSILQEHAKAAYDIGFKDGRFSTYYRRN